MFTDYTYESINVRYNDSEFEYDLIPGKFLHINLSTMGNTHNNPFFELKKVALNEETNYQDRIIAIRYMNRIPYRDMVKHVTEASIKLLKDDNIPIGERYFFFSNNEKHTKLDAYVVRDCHEFFFDYSINNKHIPLVYCLLSANYIYSTFLHNDIWNKARIFIIQLAKDDNETVNIRSEAADILCRNAIDNDNEIGKEVITKLGESYKKNKIKTIYTNLQNVHDETISESIMNIVRVLASKGYNDPLLNKKANFSTEAEGKAKEYNSNDIYEYILKNSDSKNMGKLMDAFHMILMYPAKYEGLTLCDILVLVWVQIQNMKEKSELEKRLLEELYEMDQTCGSGMLSRIVNILSGFVTDDSLQIKINIKDQIRSNIYARLGANMKLIPEKQQNDILSEIASNGNKDTAKEFVESYSVYDELLEEFVPTYIDKVEFDKIYNKCIADFLG